MEQYTGFAQVYDMFMDNVPYDEWTKNVLKLLKRNGVDAATHPLVAELGCGTGSMTRRLKNAGCDMIGIDLSEEMLDIARQKETPGDDSILYLQQDMREFELYGTVSAVVSLCDSINYITEESDLLTVFMLVRNYLDPGGVFVFDVNTPYYYRNTLGDNTICENREEGSFIWENWFDADSGINEFDITIYRRLEDGTYQRCEETHYQRAYSLGTLKKLLKKAGLELRGIYEAEGLKEPERCSERVYFVAVKK